MLDAIRDEIKRHRRHFDRPLHVGVFKLGGHGDFMQQVAFARAVRHKWPAKQATLTLLSRFDANGVNDHILQGASFVDSCIQVPTGDWRHMVQELSPAFDVFYDVQYVAGVYYRDKQRFAAQQLDANTRLARYAAYYSRFPWSNADLGETGQSQWDMLARSSGLDVSETDLHILPDAGEGVVPPGAYVTLHNAAGGGSDAKCMPSAAFHAIARRVRAQGMMPVHVGTESEPLIHGCLDRRGLPIRATAAVIAGARLHVDIEGGLVYVARAVGTRSVVFFGPTPVVTFGFQDNVNVSLARCRPCWWSRPAWGADCPKGQATCRNMPAPRQAADIVERTIEEMSACTSPS